MDLQIADFLDGVAEEHGEITGVTNLIGNMCIKPAHLTSDEEVRFQSKFAQEDPSTCLEQVVLLSQSPSQCAVLPDLVCKDCCGQLRAQCKLANLSAVCKCCLLTSREVSDMNAHCSSTQHCKPTLGLPSTS